MASIPIVLPVMTTTTFALENIELVRNGYSLEGLRDKGFLHRGGASGSS